MASRAATFSDFLKERDFRCKPNDKKILGLKRIDKIDFSGIIHLSDKPSKTDMIIVKSGDLVISGINVAKGAVTVYEGKNDITATIHYSAYEYNDKVIDINYLKWFLKSSAFTNLIKAKVPGGIKTEIKPKHLLPLEINLPEIEEQREIIKRVLNVENEISILLSEINNQIYLLSKLRQSILQDAIQGKLIPQDSNDKPASELLKSLKADKEKLIKEGKLRKEKPLRPVKNEGILFDIPKGWVWCRLGEIAISVSTGPFGTMLHKSDYVTNQIPIVNPMNMIEGKVVPMSTMTINEKTRDRLISYVLQEGDVVIARRGEMGRCAVITEKEAGWLCGTGSFFVRLPAHVDRSYFAYVLSSQYAVDYLSGSSVGATMDNLNHRILKNLPFPVPPFREQGFIVSRTMELGTHFRNLEQQIVRCKQQSEVLMQAVLKEAFDAA